MYFAMHYGIVVNRLNRPDLQGDDAVKPSFESSVRGVIFIDVLFFDCFNPIG